MIVGEGAANCHDALHISVEERRTAVTLTEATQIKIKDNLGRGIR